MLIHLQPYPQLGGEKDERKFEVKGGLVYRARGLFPDSQPCQSIGMSACRLKQYKLILLLGRTRILRTSDVSSVQSLKIVSV